MLSIRLTYNVLEKKSATIKDSRYPSCLNLSVALRKPHKVLLQITTTHTQDFTKAFACDKSIYTLTATDPVHNIKSAAGLRNMMFSANTVLTAMLAMATLAHAHMIMMNPVPFGNPNSSPLAADGSDFPCKKVAYTATTKNDWTVGSKQNLTLIGSATHSGGSCQISVTTDKAPNKQSVWKVIHSFEGGCPVPPETGGNFGDEPGKKNNAPFFYTIPPELPNGDLVMSWSWFNKEGNPEMYQNCGPVTVTGGASDNTEFDKLPDMAKANIGMGTCGTPRMVNYLFENPGKYVTRAQPSRGGFAPLCGGAVGGNAGAPGGAPVNPGVSSPAPGGAPVNPGVSSPAPVAPSPAPVAPSQAAAPPNFTSTIRAVVTVTAPSAPGASSKANATSPAAEKPTLSAGSAAPVAPSQAPAKPSGAPAPVAPSTAPAAPGTACSPNGSIVCSPDGKQFAVCNWGKAVFQPVAAGTTCTGGKIAKRADYAEKFRTVYN